MVRGIFVGVVAFLAACNGDDKDTTTTDTGDTTDTVTTPEPTGSVRLIHLSPDAGAVDVFLDGGETAALAGVEYLDGIDYIDLPVGEHTFAVAPAGLGIGATVLTATVDVEEGVKYSAAAYGTVAGGTIAVAALVDDDAGIAASDTRFQVTHAADGVGQVDVWETNLALQVISDLDFGATTSVDVPAVALSIGLDATNDGVPEFTFQVPSLGAGAFVDVYAVLDDSGPSLVAHLPDGTVAVVPADAAVEAVN
jgi:Domain of unknown function (DUF4397)